MRISARTVGKVVLSVLLGLLSLPLIGYGCYLFACFVRIHTSNLYYTDYPYVAAGLTCLAVGLLNLWVTLHGVWRRSYYGILLAVPVIVYFAATEVIIDRTPHTAILVADTEYLSNVRYSLRDWYETNRRFPATEGEFRSAVISDSKSSYKQHGDRLPYEVVVLRDADGPRLTDVSPRPAVIYYSVSGNLQEFWITMTRLQSDVDSTAHLDSFSGWPPEFWMVHEAGRNYHAGLPPKIHNSR
jgi:hypothetical protein